MPPSRVMGQPWILCRCPIFGATRAELLNRGWTERASARATREGRLVRIDRGWYSTPATTFESTMALVMRHNPQTVF